MNCPFCHHELEDAPVIEVTPATVVTIFDVWLARESHARLTERLPVVCIESKGTILPKQPLTEAEAG